MSEKTDKKPPPEKKPLPEKKPTDKEKPKEKKPSELDEKPNGSDKKPPAPESSKGKSKGPSGLGKMFNANTTNGRANVAKATYAGIFLTYLYFRAKKGKKPPPEKSPPNDHKDHNDYNDYKDQHDDGHTRHTSGPGGGAASDNSNDINKWQNRINNTADVFIVPNYKNDINLPNEMGDVPKSLPDSTGSTDNTNNNSEQIRESVALNKLKRRISQNPRFMDP